MKNHWNLRARETVTFLVHAPEQASPEIGYRKTSFAALKKQFHIVDAENTQREIQWIRSFRFCRMEPGPESIKD